MPINERSASPSVSYVLLAALCGCGAESPADLDATRVDEQASALEGGCEPTVAAGDGWINRPVTSESSRFSVGWRSSPSATSDGRPIDSVIGLSSGAAAAFTDLGPILRFNQGGSIDARDGNAYTGGFPYTFGDGPYEFQLLVDVPDHRYSAWVRHMDSPFKPFEVLAQDAAFRTEQQSVASLANLARIVDSASGAMQTCSYSHTPASGCSSSGAQLWQSRPFTTLGNQRVVLDFHTWVSGSGIDAVVGASLGAPSSFGDLAAIVRFRPDGYVDARNGSAYAAETQVTYAPNTYYHVNFEIDLTTSRYSVTWAGGQQNAAVIARDYAFRTERTGVASLDHLAQFVDSQAGELTTCALVAH